MPPYKYSTWQQSSNHPKTQNYLSQSLKREKKTPYFKFFKMAYSSCSSSLVRILLTSFIGSTFVVLASASNFYQDVDITWGGDGRAKILNNGGLLTLSLDKTSGSGFQSKKEYLFGKIDMQLKTCRWKFCWHCHSLLRK